MRTHVDRAPPDIVLGGLLVDDTLVLGRATGLLARVVDQSARSRDHSALVLNRILVEHSDRGVTLEVDLLHIEAGLREQLEVLADE